MTNYELVCILDPQLGDPEFERVIETYESYLGESGAEVKHIDRWGTRKLAYTSVGLKGRRQGYYVLFQFTAESQVLDPLEQRLKLDEGVLRYLVVAIKGEFLRVPQLAAENMIFGEPRRPREARGRGGPPGDGPDSRSRRPPPRAEAPAEAPAAEAPGGEEATEPATATAEEQTESSEAPADG